MLTIIYFKFTSRIYLLFLFAMLIYISMPAYAQRSVYTSIPSIAGGAEGIVVRIDIPPYERYQEGAPIVIYSPGGFSSAGINTTNARLYLEGFIELRFNFPAGVTGKYKSGGTFDYRGYNCLSAYRDVIIFALGYGRDIWGRFLDSIIKPTIPLYDDVGLAGYSYGGVTNICTAGAFAKDIKTLAWIVNWESPLGDGMAQAECGAINYMDTINPDVNPAYNPDTGEWDMSSLGYEPAIRLEKYDKPDDYVIGGFYFDVNRNGKHDPFTDFTLFPLVFDLGSGYKAYNSIRVMNEATARGLFPANPPEHIISADSTRAFWFYRNNENWIDSIVKYIPKIMFIVTASEIDHVQSAPDHPHVLLQYEKFRSAGAPFVRLNPDRAYVEDIAKTKEPTAVDNEANIPYDHISIRTAVEPGGQSDVIEKALVGAAACELADRTWYKVLNPQIDAVIKGPLDVFDSRNNSEAELEISPNPFSAQTRISIQVPETAAGANIELKIIDILGKELTTLFSGVLAHGRHEFIFDSKNYVFADNGSLFICRLRTQGRIISKKIVSLP